MKIEYKIDEKVVQRVAENTVRDLLENYYGETLDFLNLNIVQLYKDLADFEPFREILVEEMKNHGCRYYGLETQGIPDYQMDAMPEWRRLIDNLNAANLIVIEESRDDMQDEYISNCINALENRGYTVYRSE